MAFAAGLVKRAILGGWPYGYASWRVELTPFLKFGADNVIAIRLDNPPESSRWYPGGGIYRNVWLVKTSPVHVGHWGTFVTTPEVSASVATAHLQYTVENASPDSAGILVRTAVYKLAANGQKIG